MKMGMLLFAAVAALNLFAEGGSKMPMLSWAGKAKVVNHHNDVQFQLPEWRKCPSEENCQTKPRSRVLNVSDCCR